MNKKIISIISSRVQAKKLVSLIRKSEYTGLKIIPISAASKIILDENKIDFSDCKGYPKLSYAELCRETVSLMEELGNPIKYEIKGIDLWDLIENNFCIWVLELVWQYRFLERIIDIERPDEILVVYDGDIMNNIISEICRTRGIALSTIAVN